LHILSGIISVIDVRGCPLFSKAVPCDATADKLSLCIAHFIAVVFGGPEMYSIAVLDSQETTLEMGVDQPMPKWGWGVPGGPFQN